MRIVDRATFLTLPPGTVFMKFEPCVFGELSIKEETSGTNDFVVQVISPWFVGDNSGNDFADTCFRLKDGGEAAVDLDFAGRDGRYDADQLFAIWSVEDTLALLQRLGDALIAQGHESRLADAQPFRDAVTEAMARV